MHIEPVTAADVDEVLPLMRAYCDFYGVAPSDDALADTALTLMDDPHLEGIQLIARDDDGRAPISACVDHARERGAASLQWQTAKDNLKAQAVYDRVGAKREEWLDYSLPTGAERPERT